MRLNNKRGEVITISLVAVAIVVGLLGFFGRPVVDKMLPIFGGQQKTVQKQVITVEPVYIKLPPTAEFPKGQVVMANQISNNLSDFKGEEKVTLWSWIKSFSFVWFIGLILGAPWALTIGLKLKKAAVSAKNMVVALTTKQEELTADARKIVISVDSGLASMDANIKAANSMADFATDPAVKVSYTAIAAALVDMKQDFLAELSKKQDSTTKLLVAELKND